MPETSLLTDPAATPATNGDPAPTPTGVAQVPEDKHDPNAGEFVPIAPDSIPEKFRHKDGTLNQESIVNAYGELETKLRGAPKAPEAYTIGLPEAMKEIVDIDTESEFYTDVTGMLRKYNVSQDDFDLLMGAYGKDLMRALPDHEAESEKLTAIFGQRTDAKREAVSLALTNIFTGKDEQFEIARQFAGTAEGFQVFATILDARGPGATPGGGEPAQVKSVKEQLKELQATDAYKRGDTKAGEAFNKLLAVGEAQELAAQT